MDYLSLWGYRGNNHFVDILCKMAEYIYIAKLQSMQNNPIQLDKILLRYLKNIEFEYDQHHDPCMTWNNGTEPKNRVLIKRFEDSEFSEITHETEQRFESFKKYFESGNILRFLSYEEYVAKNNLNRHDAMRTVTLEDPYMFFWYETQLFIEVLDIDSVRKFRKKNTHTFNSETTRRLANDNKRVLYMNPSGQFFYGKNREEVSLDMETDADYFKILVGIYLSTNGCGETSIVRINEKIRNEYHMGPFKPKQISNAKINWKKFMPILSLDGREMFDLKNGILTFNNPLMD